MTRRVLAVAAAMLAVLCATIAVQARWPVLAAAEPDLARAPHRLADTGLYSDAATLTVAAGNRVFVPQYPLWTDGMTKRRWIHLPTGSAIDGRDEFDWDFPVGTKLWKEFSAGGRRVETRMLWKTADDRWVFATYEWNREGSDAILAPADGRVTDVAVGPNRRHGIPSQTDCAACHGTTNAGPLGFNALQLSIDRDPGAVHGEPVSPQMLTVAGLLQAGLLRNTRGDILTAPTRIRTSDAETRAVLGYLAANCSMCHNGQGEIAAVTPVIRYRDLAADGDAVARSLAGQPTRWQRPGVSDGTLLVAPGAPDESALYLRMRSRAPSSQMPPLGTLVRDDEALHRVRAWISRGRTTDH